MPSPLPTHPRTLGSWCPTSVPARPRSRSSLPCSSRAERNQPLQAAISTPNSKLILRRSWRFVGQAVNVVSFPYIAWILSHLFSRAPETQRLPKHGACQLDVSRPLHSSPTHQKCTSWSWIGEVYVVTSLSCFRYTLLATLPNSFYYDHGQERHDMQRLLMSN
jgi:hypothetical protein